MTGNLTATTPAQAFPIPVDGDDPDLTGDLATLAKAIEKRVLGVYASTTDRDTKLPAPQHGQFAFTLDTHTLWYRSATVWVAFPAPQPAITSGTAAPSGGADNDVYFRV